MIAYLDTVDSPAGPLAFAVDEQGALLRLEFLTGRHDTGLEEELTREGFGVAEDPTCTAEVRRQIEEYATGQRRRFELPLALRGTAWQREVWLALTAIPYGETRSYGQIAASLRRPGAARAVGRANATNRIALVVPCHRVIGADGALVGFGGGLDLKTRLLEHEARTADGPGSGGRRFRLG